jgi:hypothetical protein
VFQLKLVLLLQSRDGKKDEQTPNARPGHGHSPKAIFSPASFSPNAYVKIWPFYIKKLEDYIS